MKTIEIGLPETGRAARVLSVLAVAIAAGCATTEPAVIRGDAEVVKQQSQARWNALVANDFKTAYGFISPAGRSVVTQDAYAGSLKTNFWTGAQVEKVDCSTTELCQVDLTIKYQYGGRNLQTPLREKWVKQAGKWWYLLER